MRARGPVPRTEEQRRARRKRVNRLRSSLLNDVPREVLDALCHARPGLAAESAVIQHGFAYLALCSLLPRRAHKELSEYFSVHNDELRTRFGRDKFKPLNTKHDVFEVLQAARSGLTDAYRLKPDIREAITWRIDQANETGAPAAMLRHTGKHRRTLAPAITRASLHRTPLSPWRQANVERLVPVDVDALSRLDQRLRALAPLSMGERRRELMNMGHEGEADVPELLVAVALIRRVIRTDLSAHPAIVHEYAQKSTGRLFATGINLQSAPRIVKRAALNGLHAYDFSNCHFTVIDQLAERQGLRLPKVRDLLDHKREWRIRLAAHCGSNPTHMKLCLIRIGYGAYLYIPDEEEDWDSVTELIGPERARLFYSYPDVRELRSELRHARKAILASSPRRRGRIVNAMGIPYDPKRLSDGAKDTEGTRFAHILQGFEARMLCTVVSMYPRDVVLLEHDGWTSRCLLDTSAIESRILEATGFRMTLETELIKAPC